MPENLKTDSNFTAMDDHAKACKNPVQSHWYYNGMAYHQVDSCTAMKTGLQVVLMTVAITSPAPQGACIEVDFRFSFGVN